MKAFSTLWERSLRIGQWIAERRERRRSIRELCALSDRQLKDIGIARGQIPDIVDGMLARKRALAAAGTERSRRYVTVRQAADALKTSAAGQAPV